MVLMVVRGSAMIHRLLVPGTVICHCGMVAWCMVQYCILYTIHSLYACIQALVTVCIPNRPTRHSEANSFHVLEYSEYEVCIYAYPYTHSTHLILREFGFVVVTL